MAHTCCYKNHSMWNGDGKPEVWTYRLGFLMSYMARYPGFKLGVITPYHEYDYQIYDMVDELEDEYPDDCLDVWYCDECGCVAVFYSDYRADYEPIKIPAELSYEDIKTWDDYIACRENEFEEFQEYYKGLDPVFAACYFPFKNRFKVSKDRKYIYGYDSDFIITMGFEMKRNIKIY